MTYKCGSCTWQNKDTATKCEMCNTPRAAAPAAVAAPTNWVCKNCTMVNKLTDAKCDACAAAKPAVINAALSAVTGTRYLGNRELFLLVDATGSMNLPMTSPSASLSGAGSAVNNKPRIDIVRDAATVLVQTYAFDTKRADTMIGMRAASFANGGSTDMGYLNASNITARFQELSISGRATIMPGWVQLKASVAQMKQAGIHCTPLVVLTFTDSVPRDSDELLAEFAKHSKSGREGTGAGGVGVPVQVVFILIGHGEEYEEARALYHNWSNRFPFVTIVELGVTTDPKQMATAVTAVVDNCYVVDPTERKSGAAAASMQRASSGSAAAAVAVSTKPWNCSVCTMENKGSETKCNACGQTRGVKEVPASAAAAMLAAQQAALAAAGRHNHRHSSDERPPAVAPGAAGGGGYHNIPMALPVPPPPTVLDMTPAKPQQPQYQPMSSLDMRPTPPVAAVAAKPVSAAAAVPVQSAAAAAMAAAPTACFLQTTQMANGSVVATPMYVVLGADGKPASAPLPIPNEMLTPQLLEQLMAQLQMNANAAAASGQPVNAVSGVAMSAVPASATPVNAADAPPAYMPGDAPPPFQPH